jgi:alpha-galactosidase
MRQPSVLKSSAAPIVFVTLLMSSFNYGYLMAEEQTTSASQGLRVRVSPATGDYTIGQQGAASDVLNATVAAKVDGRWIHARDFPKHSITESIVNDDLGTAHEWTVRHTGLTDAPELICTLRSYTDRPFGDVQVHLSNGSTQTIHIQAIRPLEAPHGKILDLGGPVRERFIQRRPRRH